MGITVHQLLVYRCSGPTSPNLLRGMVYDHVPEFVYPHYAEQDSQLAFPVAHTVEGVEIVCHAYHDHQDGRRWAGCWTVLVGGKPAMTFRNAGREGDDSYERWIHDPLLYVDLIRLLYRSVSTLPLVFEQITNGWRRTTDAVVRSGDRQERSALDWLGAYDDELELGEHRVRVFGTCRYSMRKEDVR